jgi:MscS family membrane protein
MKKLSIIKVLFIFVCMLMSSMSFAIDPAETITIKQIADKKQADEQVLKDLIEAPIAGPKDEHYRSTPRSSLLGLAITVKAHDYEKAVNYLDLRNLPFSLEEEMNGPDLVRKLSIIARRAMVIDLEELSNDPLGHKDDGLPGYRDRITTMTTKDGVVDILMQRVPRGDGVFVWKISNATVALIPELNEEFGYGYIGDQMSEVFPHYDIAGFEAWQIVLLLILLLICFIVSYIVTFITFKIILKTKRYKEERIQQFIIGPLRFLIMVLLFRSIFHLVSPSLIAQAFFDTRTFLILALLWILLGVVDLMINRYADHMKRNGQHDAVVLLRPAATGIKLIIVVISIVSWLDNLGYPVTTLVAGLGVGGIAVALAAQKSLENLIGSITIYASRPVRVGDFCKFGSTLGTVEEIGLRSTQIRTLGRTVVHVPNALFASKEIENLTQRDKILYRTRLHLSYNDKPEQVRQVLANIRGLIDQHEFIDEENSRVRFLEFGEYAQELELFVYIKTREFAEYLEQVEDVNLRIADAIESAGAHLTLPAKNINLNQPKELPST